MREDSAILKVIFDGMHGDMMRDIHRVDRDIEILSFRRRRLYMTQQMTCWTGFDDQHYFIAIEILRAL